MRIVFCWSHISGYMAACWRALAQRPGVEVRVLAYRSGDKEANFADDLVAGLNVRLLDERERGDANLIRSMVVDAKPDVLVLSGWSSDAYRALASEPTLASAKCVMTMDTPYRGTMRQQLGRFKMASYFARIDRVMVPGERAWQLARGLGFDEVKIRRGMYGVDYASFAALHERRANQPGGWPRRFLFTGRYAAEKGLDVLLDAYAQYRKKVEVPWPLTCCGMGDMKGALAGREGVEDRGFVQPAAMQDVMARCGVFVLASRYDPWPLVIVESSAAGLPIVCTEACGSAVEVVRSHHNGWLVATADAADLARGLVLAQQSYNDLPLMGRRGQQLAEAYSAQAFARRWGQMCDELVR
jgi:glycosyltransferase involved in cell wall biosynthesis